MVLVNVASQLFWTSNDKLCNEHKQQIKITKLTRWMYMFRLMCGVVLILIYFIVRFQNSRASSDVFHITDPRSTVPKREANVSAVSTGPNVPLITVGVYYLPPSESNMARHRPLKETAYGTRYTSDYPIGAELLSNTSEYTIPSDRTIYGTSGRGFKYFKEMIGYPHMDAQYGKQMYARIYDSERAIILRGLFAAWSNFADENQIPSWIAHGTLLGWWWGGSLFPWDNDIDVQMNANFLYVLARFNNTVLSDRYLINVNPHFKARHPQSFNVIDARLIDKHTGYFIDITGMAATGTNIPSDPYRLLLCDKHKHHIFYSDVHPLVRTEFEGIATWRPYHVENCLIKEYGPQALLKTHYSGYNYNVVSGRWVRNQRTGAYKQWKMGS